MNTKFNKEFFESNEVVALKADKGIIPVEVAEMLTELGNPSQAIPYYAIYGPAIDEPITLEGPITFRMVTDAIEKARVERLKTGQQADKNSQQESKIKFAATR
ncbi:MAG: hypothetical protein AAGA30_12050 [Planctomycetota bacterium]